jgi:O-antigen/teichoic acid export membrane protein
MKFKVQTAIEPLETEWGRARPLIEPHTPLESDLPVEAIRARGGILATNVVWLLASQAIYAGCQWGTVVALAKFGPPASLGHFGLALAVTNPIVLTTGFSLKAYQSTDVLGRYRFADYVHVRFAANLVVGALIGGVVAAGAVDGAAAAVLIPVAIAKLADATSEVCYGLAQKHERMRFVAISKMVRGGLGLAAMALVVALGGSAAQGAWALAASWTAFLVVVDFYVAGSLEPFGGRLRPSVVWCLVRETAPLGGVTGLAALTQSLPRYLLQMSEGAAAVGYYTAMSSLGPVLSQFAAAVGNASAPRLGWAAASDANRYRTLVLRLLAAASVASLLFALLAAAGGQEFLRLAYTADYGAYWSTFIIIALAAGIGIVNSVAYYALVAARRLGQLLWVQCFGLAVTAAVCAALIPRFGLDGAAIGAALGAGATAAAAAHALLAAGGAR